MKAISILGASMAALTSLFGDRMGSHDQPLFSRHWRPTGKALRNPAYPPQAARIQAAADKRVRKATKLDRDLNRSATWNGAHRAYPSDPVAYGSNFIWNRLNPFFVNR
jgi:hypothetical protein